ncbi:hypothetical protein [Streptomyces sp. H39-S7]|uniref:hypothetical protein n=1 Tax=Streptomyces sp. H39-S7 TaxID=3004357 RepID=UPI0022AE6B15|nr:hypothetical protein [Streptomyces sp. H39-S7]MCZ4123294.1 hypothetical protein [Streptomyces sp. H39-S7]
MLSIVDELTGPGPLRICAHAPQDGEPGDLTGLRVLLVTDVLARVVELRGRAVLLGRTGPPVPSADAAGIRPADATGTLEEITEVLGGPPVVHLTPRAFEGAGGATLRVGEASGTGPLDQDVLAVRALLLGHPHHEPRVVTSEEITEAGRVLARWRGAVADWAEEPSKPMAADLVRTARAALEDSLDTPQVFRLLRELETAEDVPAGGKFETFAHLDRVLGLEVVREIGRPRSAGAPA